MLNFESNLYAGYVERKAIVEYIKQDAAILYSTLYRYFLYN